MAKCEICGKKPLSGHNVSHSMRHTKRQWKPNIQKVTIVKDGRLRKMKICSRCLRTAVKAQVVVFLLSRGNYSGMSFRPKGEIPATLLLLEIWQGKDEFYPANLLLIVAPQGFLGLRPRNDIGLSSHNERTSLKASKLAGLLSFKNLGPCQTPLALWSWQCLLANDHKQAGVGGTSPCSTALYNTTFAPKKQDIF